MSGTNKVAKYIYWGERRIDHYLKSNGIPRRVVTKGRGVGAVSPGSFGFSPSFSWSWSEEPSWPNIANTLEKKLVPFSLRDAPSGASFLKGESAITLGRLYAGSHRTGGCLFYAVERSDFSRRQGLTAVLLFASVQFLHPGLARMETQESAEIDWWSSEAPYVYDFLESTGARGLRGRDRFRSDEEFAHIALRIAMYQGGCDSDAPWLQKWRFGDVTRGCEWLAEVYFDIDVSDYLKGDPDLGEYKRVLIGAPFWIRAIHPKDPRVYASHSLDDRRRWSRWRR